MPQFLERFPEIGSGGIYKGLLTAMIELGALIGAFNQGWIADKISRKYSIVLAVVIFIVGSALQTASVDYAMLTVARLIGGVGIGMLSMVWLTFQACLTFSADEISRSHLCTFPRSRLQRFVVLC